jgi:hypothetical protein
MKTVLFYFFMMLLVSGCTTTQPQSIQQNSADMNAEIQRFEQAKALSPADIPDTYNVSRLSKGSNVKIKHTQDNSGEAYFTTKTVRDIKAGGSGKVYVIDSVTEGRTYTFSEDTASLRKVVSPYENTQPLADLKDLPGSSLPQEIVNVIGAGNIAIGIVTAPISHMQEKERNKEAGDQMRGMRIERKVVDFKFVSNETLRVAGKNIVCKVYQVHSLMRQTMPSSKLMPSSSFVMDSSERIWVCEDVPFGIVKRESTQIMHMSMAGNSRLSAVAMPSSQVTHESNEVVEFSY